MCVVILSDVCIYASLKTTTDIIISTDVIRLYKIVLQMFTTKCVCLRDRNNIYIFVSIATRAILFRFHPHVLFYL